MTNEEIQVTTYESFEGDHYVKQIESFAKMLTNRYDTKLSLLDVGCGDGTLMKTLQDLGWTEVVGFDLNERKVARAKSLGLKVAIRNAETEVFAHCDIAVCSHALEHFVDPANVVRKLIDCAKKYVVIVIPFPDLNAPLDAHIGRQVIGSDKEMSDVENFFRSFKPRNLIIERTNFRESELLVTIEK